MARDYEERWKNYPIEHLVLSTTHFVVFLDQKLDVDWATSKDYDEIGHRDGQKHNEIMDEAARIEATPCDGMSRANKLQFKRLIAEGIARSFDHDYESARRALRTAADFVLARSQETSRYWYLSASGVMTLPFVIIGVASWIERNALVNTIGDGAFWLLMSSVAGSGGALFSVIGRTGKQTFDCSAGRKLHYLEGASRIWAGAFSGILVGLAVRSEIILTALARASSVSAIMILASFAAGAGERLATSLISDISASGLKHLNSFKGSAESGDEVEGSDNR